MRGLLKTVAKWLFLWMVAGVSVPILVLVRQQFFQDSMSLIGIELFLWPTSVLISAPETVAAVFKMYATAIGLNVVLYLFVGLLTSALIYLVPQKLRPSVPMALESCLIRASRFLIAASVSLLVCLLLTYGCFHLGLWAGGHSAIRDLVFKLFLGLPIIAGVIACLWPSPALKRNVLAVMVTGAVIGLSYAYLIPRILWWMHSHSWRGNAGSIFISPASWDQDIELTVAAVAAGICAMTLALTRFSRTVATALVLVLVLAVLAPQPLFDRITHNQELTLAVMIPTEDASVLEAPDNNFPPRTLQNDLSSVRGKIHRLFRGAGIEEDKYQLVYIRRYGHGRPSLAVIVLNKPVVSKVALPEPRNRDAVFVQASSEWKTIPTPLTTVDRRLLLWPPENTGRNFGTLMIEDASGFGEGFTIPSPSQRSGLISITPCEMSPSVQLNGHLN